MDIEIEETEDEIPDEVDLIASGYEWTCPDPECDTFNHEIEITEDVTCKTCGRTYSVNNTYHARG